MKEAIEKQAEYFAHNQFNMHETNSYQELKRGFEAGAEWAIKNILIMDKKKLNNKDMISEPLKITLKQFKQTFDLLYPDNIYLKLKIESLEKEIELEIAKAELKWKLN